MTNFCQEMTVNIFSYISTGKKPKSDKEDKIKQIKVFFCYHFKAKEDVYHFWIYDTEISKTFWKLISVY